MRWTEKTKRNKSDRSWKQEYWHYEVPEGSQLLRIAAAADDRITLRMLTT